MGQTFVFICLLDGSMLAAVLAFRLKMVVKVDSAVIAQSVQVSGQCIQTSVLHLGGWVGAHCPSLHHALTDVDSPVSDLAGFFSKVFSF